MAEDPGVAGRLTPLKLTFACGFGRESDRNVRLNVSGSNIAAPPTPPAPQDSQDPLSAAARRADVPGRRR